MKSKYTIICIIIATSILSSLTVVLATPQLSTVKIGGPMWKLTGLYADEITNVDSFEVFHLGADVPISIEDWWIKQGVVYIRLNAQEALAQANSMTDAERESAGVTITVTYDDGGGAESLEISSTGFRWRRG